MKTVTVLTKNKWKFGIAKDSLNKFGITAVQSNKEFAEIQADTSVEIARHSALLAAKELGVPVIREDHSLFIHALGLPGSYTNYIERVLPAERLLRLLSLFPDRTGHFEVALVYAEPTGVVKEFVYDVPIRLATEQRGELSQGWNKIIILEGENRTIAEYPEDERNSIWNRNYIALAKELLGDEQNA